MVCLKHLNVRAKITSIPEEKKRQRLLNIGFGNDFLDLTPTAQATKEKTEAPYFFKTKSFVHQRTLSLE